VRRRAFLAALTTLGLIGIAVAQDAPGNVHEYFPMQVGSVWTYNLSITSGQQTRAIEYTTRAARTEEVGGLTCVVFEDSSGNRQLQVNWYALDAAGPRIVQPQRQSGRSPTALCRVEAGAIGPPGRIIIDQRALAALPEKATWPWASPDGTSRGEVSLVGRERVRLRNFGELDCLVLLDAGTASSGGRTATIERRLWLAAGLGCVQERTTITVGEERTVSEATLIGHQAP
jgi:hypothetical protein